MERERREVLLKSLQHPSRRTAFCLITCLGVGHQRAKTL